MKTVRLYIKKPIRIEWSEFSKTIKDFQYETAKALNFCMSELFLFEEKRKQWKEENGKFPTKKELPYLYLYPMLRSRFNMFSGGMSAEIARKAELRFKTDRKEVSYSYKKSLPTFKQGHPILIRKQDYKLEETDHGYVFNMLLFPKETGKKRLEFLLNSKMSKGQKNIIEKIFSSEWKTGAAQIGRNEKKNKFFVNISYEPGLESFELKDNIVVGVDLGISTAISCYSTTGEGFYIKGGEIERFRKTIKRRRIDKQKQYKTSCRKGNGRKRALLPIESIQQKEKNFSETINHAYSKAIIDFAKKNKAKTIQIENLSGLIEKKREAVKWDGYYFLKNWTVYSLQQKLKYKAEEAGIEVIEVKPDYTSQRCNKCGHTARNNRKKQSDFLCERCGWKCHADRNAAMNLSIPRIDDIILRETIEREKTRTKEVLKIQ